MSCLGHHAILELVSQPYCAYQFQIGVLVDKTWYLYRLFSDFLYNKTCLRGEILPMWVKSVSYCNYPVSEDCNDLCVSFCFDHVVIFVIAGEEVKSVN